jgi:hypothetical protein
VTRIAVSSEFSLAPAGYLASVVPNIAQPGAAALSVSGRLHRVLGHQSKAQRFWAGLRERFARFGLRLPEGQDAADRLRATSTGRPRNGNARAPRHPVATVIQVVHRRRRTTIRRHTRRQTPVVSVRCPRYRPLKQGRHAARGSPGQASSAAAAPDTAWIVTVNRASRPDVIDARSRQGRS